MSRGPRQQHQQHHNHNQQQQNHGAGTTTTASATNSPPQHARRANRTLGWYLGGLMAEKNQNAGAGGGMEVNQATKENTSQHQMHIVTANEQQRRKRSVVDTSSSATAHTDPRCSSPRVQHTGNGNSNWHHRQKMMAAAGDRTRASSSASSASKKSATKPEGHQQPQQQQSQFGKEQQNQPQQQHQQIELHKMGAGGAGSKPASGKENYWYYDPVSDGYYYEHNGTRGWRKRSAKLDAAVQAVQMKRMEGIQQKIAEQQKKFATAAAEAKAGGAIPSLLGGSASQQLNKFFPGNATNNVPFGSPMAIKYYDNDGYFYEMASVDGWRRRQPTTGSTSATNGGISTPPNSLASSLGGTTSHQPPKVPSPAPAAIANAKPPRRKPLHYAAYQQPPPQLLNTSLDLKELLLLAKQQQQHHHNHQQQQQPPCCCPAAVGANLMAPSPAPCCCTIAAMAAQMILQKHRQLVERSSIGGASSEHNNSATLTTAEIPKTKSMECVRSLLEGLSVSKPASVAKEQQQHLLSSTNSQTNIGGGGGAATPLMLATAQQNKAAQQQQVDSVAANWQFSQSNKWNGFGTAAAADDKTTNGSGNNNNSTTTTLSVGSFEEPYEFYWSGDETSSEVVAPHVIGTGKLAPPAMALTDKHEESETIGGGGDGEQATMISSSTTAASVSSMDDDGLDEMMQSGGVEIPQPKQQQKRDPLSIAPIGSEATMRRIGVEEEKAAQQQQHQRYQLKRPDFLRLACPPKSMQIAAAADYEPMSPGEVLKEFMDNGGETAGRRRRPNKIGINAMPQQQQQPHNFDVDKFIADLPPMPFDHERFLQNLRNPLRTPIGPAPATFEPIPNDSPLFTPICFGKNAWGYRQHENPWAYP